MTENRNAKNEKATSEELKRILENHKKWLRSKGKEGQLSDLSDANPFVRIHHHHNYRDEILNSESAGCFYCLEIYSPDEIIEWHGEDDHGVEQVAMCPEC
jgi:hypothetical protein